MCTHRANLDQNALWIRRWAHSAVAVGAMQMRRYESI